MITHPAMAVHPNVQDVLIIGAGDGGTLREICRYPFIKHIDLVEIDEDVITVSRASSTLRAGFGSTGQIHIDDGLAFVRHYEEVMISS